MQATRLIQVLVALYAIGLSFTSVGRYRAGATHFYDLGVYSNVVWQAAHGRLFYYPQYEMSFFGDHFAPLLFLFVPFYWVYAHPCVLVILQSVALALGAIPLALATRGVLARASGSGGPFGSPLVREAAVVVLVLLYFANVALLHISMFDFHPIAFAIPLTLAAYQAAQARRWARFWLMSALLLACQEESAITVASFGLFLLLFGEDRSQRRHGAVLAAVAAVYFGVVMTLVIPAFRGPAGESGWVYVTRYAHLGASLGEVLRTIVFRPLHTLVVSYEPYKLETLLQLFLPLGLLPLLGWRTLLVALPSLFYNYISGREHQFLIQYQYFSMTLPWLLVSASWGLLAWSRIADRLTRTSRQRRWLPAAVCAVPLIAAFDFDLYYLARTRPIRSGFYAVWPHWKAIDELRAIIGPDASVSVTNGLGAYFSERPEIYLSLDFIHNRDLVRFMGISDYHDTRFHLFDLSNLSGSRDREKRILALLHDRSYGLRYLEPPFVLFERGFAHAGSRTLEELLPQERRLPDGSYATTYAARLFLRGDARTVIERKDASGERQALELRPGTRSIAFGPYVTLAAGRYTALFDLERVPAPGESAGSIGAIDVAAARGKRILAAADLSASQFGAGPSEVPLDFALPAETLEVEFRTRAIAAGLVLRRVTLLRLAPSP